MKRNKLRFENCDSFLVAFKKARKKAHKFIESRIKEYELTSNQIDVLIFLMHNEEYNTAKDIVEYIGVSKGLVSRSIDGLIKRNFMYAEEDKNDRRKLRLFLTDKGNEIVQKIDKYDNEFLSMATAGISQEEFDVHISLVKKLLDNLKSME